MGAAELRDGAQQAGGDEVHQLVEVRQAILHRGGGEQQQVAGPQRPRELARCAGGVAQPVRLVDDHHVPPLVQDRGAQRVAPGRGERRQHHRAVVALVPATPCRDRGGQPELAFQLLAPLIDQTGRGDHQRAVGEPAHPQLGEHQPGLDGLAQPDLVGQDRPAPHPSQHRLHGGKLVVERGETQPRLRQDRVEPRPAPHRTRLVDQRRAIRIDAPRAHQLLDQRRITVRDLCPLPARRQRTDRHRDPSRPCRADGSGGHRQSRTHPMVCPPESRRWKTSPACSTCPSPSDPRHRSVRAGDGRGRRGASRCRCCDPRPPRRTDAATPNLRLRDLHR